MTNDNLEIQIQRLAESQEKFVSSVNMMHDMVGSLTDYLSDFRAFMAQYKDMFVATRDLMENHNDTSKALLEALNAVVKSFADSTITINENSERLEKLTSKVETYFGNSPGRDYNN